MDFDILLKNPELAKNIRFEISGSDLLSLSAAIIKISKEQDNISKKEDYLKLSDVIKLVKRSQPTLSRWKNKGILVPNQIGLYKKSDVDKFLSK